MHTTTNIYQGANTPSTLQNLTNIKTNKLPKGLKVATTKDQKERIEDFREKIFGDVYPELGDFHNDAHDAFSLILYTENEKAVITSTARLIFDNPIGFPADEYANNPLNEHRRNGIKMVEAGRLAISEEAKKEGAISLYYQAFYALSVENDIDSIIVVINENHVNFYRNRLGAQMLTEYIENIAGSPFKYACMEWKLSKTTDRFLKWVGIKSVAQKGDSKRKLLSSVKSKDAPYPVSIWNKYSRNFASIYTDYQRKVYHEASMYLLGSVVDLGCGPARLAPLLADNANISQYIGVEYADDMFEIAEFTMNKLSKPSFEVFHQKVEEVQGQYTSAVSLLSYYAFSDPAGTLRHIFKILCPGSSFVLANPNENLDQVKLLKEVEKEMMWHSEYESFKDYNLKLANNPQAGFVPMDQLIKQLQSVGFEIVTCHQRHYEGGLNFIVCKKPF